MEKQWETRKCQIELNKEYNDDDCLYTVTLTGKGAKAYKFTVNENDEGEKRSYNVFVDLDSIDCIVDDVVTMSSAVFNKSFKFLSYVIKSKKCVFMASDSLNNDEAKELSRKARIA